MRRRIITFLIILVCFLLQCTVFRKLTFAGIGPNLLIVVTAAFGFMQGQKTGMVVGFICGLFMDLFWGNGLGFNMLLYTIIGYLNGTFEQLFYDEDITLPLVLIGFSELTCGLMSYVVYHLLEGDFMFGTYLVQVIIPELVYTILVTLILYQIILWINRRLEVEEEKNASRFV